MSTELQKLGKWLCSIESCWTWPNGKLKQLWGVEWLIVAEDLSCSETLLELEVNAVFLKQVDACSKAFRGSVQRGS